MRKSRWQHLVEFISIHFFVPPFFHNLVVLDKCWGKNGESFSRRLDCNFFAILVCKSLKRLGDIYVGTKKCIVHFPTYYLSREESMYIYTKTDQTMESLFKNNVNCLQNNVLICIWHVTLLSDAIKKKLNAHVEKM